MTSAAWIAAVLCSLIVATLIRDGLHLRYEVTGSPTWRATWSP